MRTNALDLNAAYIFTQVVISKSFTEAARVLGIPKSTVSDRVAELEKQLGVTLMTRTTRKLKLTDIGLEFFKNAELAISQLQVASEQASSSQKKPTGRLKIIAPSDFALPEIMEAVSNYRKKFPEVTVDFQFSDRDVNLIAEGYDMAIRGGPQTDSSMIAKKVGVSCLILVASPGYLKTAPPLKHPRDIALHSCINMNDPSVAREFWDLRTPQGKVARVRFLDNAVSANSFNAVKSLVLFGDGIGLMPRALCKNDFIQKTLVHVLPEWSTADLPLYLVYPAQRYSSSKLKEFIPLIEEKAKKLLFSDDPRV
jgi:DNA-binding transcriptional LysR family regulator